MMKYFFLVFFVFVQLSICSGETYYISPNGSLSNPGTEESPFSFKYLERKIDHSGDIFIVKEGLYPGHWVSLIYGRKNSPVIIKSEKWLTADLVGIKEKRNDLRRILTIKGKYSWYQGFEIYEKDAQNRIANNGEEFFYSDGAHLEGIGSKIINCVAHDVLVGFSSWSPAIEGEIYGCIAYNIGWNNLNSKRKSKGHGHGFYIQNKEGNKLYKKIHLNIVWGTASAGFHCYTEKGNIEYFHFENNLAYNLVGYNPARATGRGYIMGGYKPLNRLKFIENHIYKEAIQFGYGSINPIVAKNAEIEKNYFWAKSIVIYDFQDINSFRENSFIGPSPFLIVLQGDNDFDKTFKWPFENNIIYKEAGKKDPVIGAQERNKGTKYLKLKDTPWSGLNNEIRQVIPPSKAFVYQNAYDNNRANVYVYNHKGLGQFPIDLKGFAKKGDSIEIRDVENIQKIILSKVIDNTIIKLPMDLKEMAMPRGNLPVGHLKHSDKGFNAFIVIKH